MRGHPSSRSWTGEQYLPIHLSFKSLKCEQNIWCKRLLLICSDCTFALDTHKLQKRYLQLQRSLHPDNFSQKSVVWNGESKGSLGISWVAVCRSQLRLWNLTALLVWHRKLCLSLCLYQATRLLLGCQHDSWLVVVWTRDQLSERAISWLMDVYTDIHNRGLVQLWDIRQYKWCLYFCYHFYSW